MKKKLILGAIFTLTMLLTGCSSLVNGPTQDVEVKTNVENLKSVRLYRDGVFVAEGKKEITNFTLDRKHTYVIDVIDTKGESHKLQLNKSLTNSFLFGNLFVLGLPGWIIDMMTGSAYKFKGQSPEITVK